MALSVFVKSVLARVILFGHSLFAVSIVVDIKESKRYWWFAAVLFFLVIESFVTICLRKSKEYKWICPGILCHLITVVPCTYILEYSLLEKRIEWKKSGETKRPPNEIWYENITDVMEQTILLVMIFCRWLMPKGKLSRDELSQLLLINMASAADIIEFFDIINIHAVSYDSKMITYVLVLWSWSLLQFPLNTAVAFNKLISGDEPKPDQPLTITRLSSLPAYIVKRMSSNIYAEKEFEAAAEGNLKPDLGEFASIMVGLLLQDGPYLTMRLFIISYYKTFGYMIVFLTVKNSLFLILEVYRLCVLFCHCKDSSEYDPSPDSQVSIQSRFRNIQIAIPQSFLNAKILPKHDFEGKTSDGGPKNDKGMDHEKN